MRKILFLLFLFALPALLWAAEPVRVWKDKQGRTIQATYDSARDFDPEYVPLIKGGRIISVKLKNLSYADQDYVIKARNRTRSLNNDFDADSNKRGIAVVPAGRRYALLIGVNEYATPLPSLKFCVQDMNYLSECFQRLGFSQENIFLVTDNSPVERRPTGANIRSQIVKITNLMGSEDQLIIAFSGHGTMRNGKSYLCPNDVDQDNIESFVSRDWVFDQMEKCKAKQKILIIDACRNEMTPNGQKAFGGPRTLEDPIGADTHGFILIASCSKSQYSWENPEIQHGVFTYFLGRGISGEAADEDGYITIMNLFQFASSRTKSFVFRNHNVEQVPSFGLRGEETTDFCIGKLNTKPQFSYGAPTVEQPAFMPPSPVQTPYQPQSVVQTPSSAMVAPVLTPSSLKPGTRHVLTVKGVEFAFRWCPPGTFMMGSPESEENRDEELEEQHQVTLTKGFWIMETEVTQKQWKAIMGKRPDDSYKGDKLPVECVSWNECQDFCAQCAQFGLKLQLPTEAQWEYACRAGSRGMFAGDLNKMAWHDGNSGYKPQPVGTKKPNAWGLYDMHGNAHEWCQDVKEEYSSESVTDPTGPSYGNRRIYRGGS